MNLRKLILTLLLVPLISSNIFGAQANNNNNDLVKMLLDGSKESGKKIKKYLDLKRLCIELADIMTEDDDIINTKDIYKQLIRAIRFARIPEIFSSNHDVWSNYVDLKALQSTLVSAVDSREITPDDLLDIIKVSQCATLFGMTKEQFEDCIDIKDFAKILSALCRGESVSRQIFFRAINIKKLEESIKEEPEFLQNFLSLKTFLAIINDSIIGEDIDLRGICNAMNRSLNWGKVISTLLDLDQKKLEELINFDNIKNIVQSILEKKNIDAKDIHAALKKEIGAPLNQYITQEALEEMLADIANGKKISKELIRKVINFRKLEFDLGLNIYDIEGALSANGSTQSRINLISKMHAYIKPHWLYRSKGIALFYLILSANGLLQSILNYSLGLSYSLEPEGFMAKAGMLSALSIGGISAINNDPYYIAKLLPDYVTKLLQVNVTEKIELSIAHLLKKLSNCYEHPNKWQVIKALIKSPISMVSNLKKTPEAAKDLLKYLHSGLVNARDAAISNSLTVAIDYLYALMELTEGELNHSKLSIDELIRGWFLSTSYGFLARKCAGTGFDAELEPGAQDAYKEFVKTISEAQRLMLKNPSIMLLAQFRPQLIQETEPRFFASLTEQQRVLYEQVINPPVKQEEVDDEVAEAQLEPGLNLMAQNVVRANIDNNLVERKKVHAEVQKSLAEIKKVHAEMQKNLADNKNIAEFRKLKGYEMLADLNKGNFDSVVNSIKLGADLIVIDNGGNSALHLAVIKQNEEIVNLLLSKKINVDIKNGANLTALELARFLDSRAIIKILTQKKS